ncbi:MAG: 1,2-phenylacetyl-CoA epoxidase subunit B [Bdellovibrionales bacterium]|nr:1,2-phenylacetyl-CoA epoxidase subunit B [Bdellovibrionales bacterium]
MSSAPPARADGDFTELFEVFVQEKAGEAHQHVGSVRAAGPSLALQHARDVYARRSSPASIWVVPTAAITATVDADIASFFEPAADKAYRHPQFYRVPKDTPEES